MLNSIKKNKKFVTLAAVILLAGLLLRIYFVEKILIGDVLVHAEWGEKLFDLGLRKFYFEKDWYYSKPTQPPLTSLMFGGSYWLFEQKFRLAQLHNLIKIPPAFVIEYYYKYGYWLLLKLPAILADLGLGVVVCWAVYKLTKDKGKALIAMVFLVLNPVTIFISSVWGQTESLIAFFGILGFIALVKKNVALSIPLFFISLYLKPTWAIFVPLYIFVFFNNRPKILRILAGLAIAFLIYIFSTYPFSGGNIIEFSRQVIVGNILPSAKGTAKASISMFNTYTVFHLIDRTFANEKIFSIITLKSIGLFFYLVINFYAIRNYLSQRDKLLGIFGSLFIVGFGSVLLLTNMLERYFFVGFVPLVVLLFSRPKMLLWGLAINAVFFLNLIWAFFRRKYDEIDKLFTANSFLSIRILSLVLILGWYKLSANLCRK